MIRRILFFGLMSLMFVSVAKASTSKAVFAFTYAPYQLGDVELQTNNGNQISTQTGWYNSSGFHGASNPDYIVGLCGSSDSCNGGDTVTNNFLVFSVPAGQYTSATISAYLPNPGLITAGTSAFYCACSSLTYQLWDVSTPIGELVASQSGRTDIYNDLGSGVLFGSVVITPGEQGTQILISLNAAGLASVNAAAGNEWAVGGSIFGAETTTPEPGTITMLLSGLGAGFGVLRRRKLI
jgi:hypothetical protein